MYYLSSVLFSKIKSKYQLAVLKRNNKEYSKVYIFFYLWMVAKFQSSVKRLHFEETLIGGSGVFKLILLTHKDYTKTCFSEFSRQYFADGFSIVSLSVQLLSQFSLRVHKLSSYPLRHESPPRYMLTQYATQQPHRRSCHNISQ